MAKFFIDRPIFAVVIAIVIVILGAAAVPNLPVATYPEVVPPVVQITANFRGANAQDLERTVAQPIEQQLIALDGMLYFFSRSSNDGVLTVDVTFDLGTNVDTAVVQTQNRVSLALPALPSEVQREGVTVKKLSTAILLGMAFTSKDDRYDATFLDNFVTINVLDRIASLPGVGEVRLASRQDYGMRIWVNPAKMASLGVTAADVSAAIQAQNRQNASGTIRHHPVRGDRARRPRRLHVSPELAPDDDPTARGACVDRRDLCAVSAPRLLDQHDQHVRPRPRDRHRRRRRDRGGGGGAAQDRSGDQPAQRNVAGDG